MLCIISRSIDQSQGHTGHLNICGQGRGYPTRSPVYNFQFGMVVNWSQITLENFLTWRRLPNHIGGV